ncbi:HPF/RaiA family ribosome-associated protein, partial [Bacillus safensis]|nr:HPF/RaiA family ribosome-associated protein [Bacillus safensis]
MTLRVSGKHMDVGEAFTTRIIDRVNEAVGKYFDHGFSGQVTVTKSGSRFSADCTLHLDSGATLQSTGEAQDPQ